jgi:flagellar hook-associated protein 3 FlgL
MRITDQFITRTLANTTTNALGRVFDVSMQIASGKKIQRVSQDPMSAVRILDANAQISKIDVWVKNTEKVKEEAKASYDALDLAHGQMTHIDGLLLSAVNGGNSRDMLDAIITEIEARTKILAQLANTKYGDTFIFAGTNTHTVPYTLNEDDDGVFHVQYHGTQNTENWQRRTEIFENEEVAVNILGQNVFGDENEGIFATIQNVLSALKGEAPDFEPDLEAAREEINHIQAGLKKIANAMATASNTVTHAKAIGDVNASIYDNIIETRAGLRDTDVIQASTELAIAQTTLEASMKITGALLQRPSLLHFV